MRTPVDGQGVTALGTAHQSCAELRAAARCRHALVHELLELGTQLRVSSGLGVSVDWIA